MPYAATPLPVRRAGLVCWRAGDNGQWLVRNRSTGESFQLGEEEHFLLERLDGHQTADEICRAFAERFGEPISGDDLDEFIQLAERRGLVQCDDEKGARTGDGGRSTPYSVLDTRSATLPTLDSAAPPTSLPARRPVWKRMARRSFTLFSALLRWPARILSAAAARLDMFRLTHLDFVPRPDDVFIVTYPRSGTTWMQMILYQLTTDGNMDVPHIAEYCPWFERSVRSATAFETRPSPRLFKSHLPYHKIPGNGVPRQSLGTRPKYIYVARNGKDVAVSYYHLYRTYNGFEGTFDEFFDRFLKGKTSFGCWFKHVKGWWEHRDDPHVLFLTYEELSRDLEGSIRRIADFIGRDVPPERLPGIVERCSFAFMKQHEHKFDPALETLWEQGIRLKSFLRNGRVGDGAVCLTEEQQARFDEAFHKRLKESGIPLS